MPLTNNNEPWKLGLKNIKEYCKFYLYCIHSHYRKIICRKEYWINCKIYKKLTKSE